MPKKRTPKKGPKRKRAKPEIRDANQTAFAVIQAISRR